MSVAIAVPLIATPAVAATRSEAAACAVLGAAEGLAEVLKAENTELAAGDVAAVRSLAPRRREVCHEYEQALRTLTQVVVAEGLPTAATRRSLDRAAENLRPLLTENARRLAAFIAARERVMQVIAGALRDHEPGVRTYARSGTAYTLRHLPATAVSVNRAL